MRRENGYDDLPDGVGKPATTNQYYPSLTSTGTTASSGATPAAKWKTAPCYTVGGEVYRVGEDDSMPTLPPPAIASPQKWNKNILPAAEPIRASFG